MYIGEYARTKETYIQEFYLYEIIHHLKKITDIYREINENKRRYISNLNKELLDSYRIQNFIVFTKAILKFLDEKSHNMTLNEDFHTDLVNLTTEINKWE